MIFRSLFLRLILLLLDQPAAAAAQHATAVIRPILGPLPTRHHRLLPAEIRDWVYGGHTLGLLRPPCNTTFGVKLLANRAWDRKLLAK